MAKKEAEKREAKKQKGPYINNIMALSLIRSHRRKKKEAEEEDMKGAEPLN